MTRGGGGSICDEQLATVTGEPVTLETRVYGDAHDMKYYSIPGCLVR